MIRRGIAFACASLLVLVAFSRAAPLPSWLDPSDRVDDAAFWRMFTEFSEPSGFFQSDNLVSNETAFPAILQGLATRHSATSAYVGVGPEQNFSYLAAVRPRIAFIVDIRRQNAMLHLLYKALFERAPDRVEFLSRLFSRPKPKGIDERSSVGDLLAAFAGVQGKESLFASNLKEVRKRLLTTHGFPLGEEDLAGVQYVYAAFFEAGPSLKYSTGSGRRGRPFPTFAELVTAADDAGVARSFLASEENYRVVRELEQRNLVIPVVGNFGGSKALKSVGTHLASRGLFVTLFYTSNVEMYLFRNDEWRGFYENVASLPRDSRSVLVRSVFGGFGGFRPPGPDNAGGGRFGTLQVDPMPDLVDAYRRGDIAGYGDVLARSR